MSKPIRSVILDQIKEIAVLHRKELVPLTDTVPLLETGLDSLCIAVLVAQLEDETGLDPFSSQNAPIPVTLGDFIRLYEHAAA
jgi:acyl carrier protein